MYHCMYSDVRCMVVIVVGLMAVCAALFSRVVLMSMTAFGTLLLCVPSVIALLVSSDISVNIHFYHTLHKYMYMT